MSDSDSGPEFVDCDIRHGAKLIYDIDSPFVALQPPDVIYERWNKIPVILKKKAAQLMQLCAFWYHILLRQENHNTTRWAVQVGFLDSNVSNDLSLKRLHKIEILEAILRAMEKGCLLEDQTRHMIWISNKFNLHVPEVLDEAIHWLERTGEPRIKQRVEELGPRGNCFAALQLIFTEYSHYTQAMGVNRKKMMRELAQGPCQWSIEKSEEMKTRGNDQFQKKKYDAAVKCYSKAIKYHPENHIIYGNRALCYIRSEKYLKAVGDGKRATLIQPEWAKGHYRYCEALFLLGEHKRAIEANEWGQTLCKADSEGMKDLLQQYAKFNIEIEESKRHQAEERKVGRLNKTAAKKVSSRRTESTTRADTTESQQQTAKPTSKVEPSTKNTAPENKGSEVKVESQTQPVKGAGRAHSVDNNTKAPKETKGEMADKKISKPEPSASEKSKGKSRNKQSKEKTVSGSSRDPSVRDALVSAVQEAHTALTDQRCRNAEQAFSQALSILETSTPKELGLCALDQVVLIYGHASALIEIGQPEELAEAQRDFEKIKTFEERKFQCLVFYGIGKAYQKENRFPLALEQFSDSMQMVKKKITPGKLTWPTTKVIVEETKPGYFKELLEESIEMCKFPPKPDAICLHQNCHGHSKIEIYFTDPDFKGFIRMVCCQSCKVEYHISCWKKLKATAFSDKNEKDFLQEMCFTPDCLGRICHIKIYGSTGLVKCEFEASIEKLVGTATLRVNQKCTSLKKLKSKEDRKLRRKQHRQDASLSTQDKNDQIPLENGETIVVGQKASSPTWLAYGDRVLLQISESKDLFRDESHNISVLMENLKPWMDLDRIKGNELGTSYAGRQPETLGDVVALLLERKNRVWARVFIHSLSGCLDTSPKLHNWAHQLNSAGLNSAGLFIDRYADHLEQLDLAPLLNFAPLQDMLIEKFGTMPEFFSSRGLTLTEYLKQAPPQEMRLFIWTLEEHRDQYTTCHTVLDYYFEIMDGDCLVIKKTGIENEINSPIKTRNRNRKKKQKEPKGSVIVLSGMRGGTSREEDEEDFLDDSLMFFDSSDPFSIPDHLRNQVAEFEGQYNNGSRSSHYNRILDNNPDPTKESLYDYFAQILEEYGPLGAQDPLLVGELNNFPSDAQQKIQEAGGLEPFLLESLRFVRTDNLLGLMKHAVSLQDANTHRMDDLDFIGDIPNGLSLNPSAMEFLPNSHDSGPRDYDEEPFANIHVQPNLVEVCGYLQGIPTLPSPYIFPAFGSQAAPPANGIAGAIETLRAEDKSYNNHDPDNLEDFDLDIRDVDEQGLLEAVYAPVRGAKAPGKTAVEVQVLTCDTLSEVAVNTEPYEPFEGNNGDMNKKEKSNAEFEQQIQQMVQDYGAVKQRRQKEISALEGEQEEINHSIQVTHKELGLFQQKLEEEVKKDQQEKKENQEILKALKTEIKELAESQESISKNIHEKNKEYETQLNNFLVLSNQSAAEKMSLEDEIKRCRDLCAKATRRSRGAELSKLENRRSRGLRCLYRSLSDARAILAKLKEVAPRFPSQILQSATDAWIACVQEAEEKIHSTEAQYQDQIEQVKRGTRLCTLPPVAVPSAPRPPPVPICSVPEEDPSLVPLCLPYPVPSIGPPPGLSFPLVAPGLRYSAGFTQQAEHVLGLHFPIRGSLGPEQSLDPLPMHGPELGFHADDIETPDMEQESKQEVLENKDVIVQRVHIDGLGRTKEDCLTYEIADVFRAKNLIDVMKRAHEARQKLLRLGIFRQVEVVIDTSQGVDALPNGLDVTFDVTELRRMTGSYNTMVGNNEGCMVLGLKLPNVFGRAEKLTFQFSYGTKETSYGLSFFKPQPGHFERNFAVNLYKVAGQFPWSSLRETDRGVSTEFSFPLWKTNHTLKWEGVWRELGCLTRTASFVVREESGHSLKSSLSHSMVIDTRNSAILPRSGALLKINQELAGYTGGDASFLKEDFEIQFNRRLFWDSVLSASLWGGCLLPIGDKPTCIADRFYLGGPTSVRGFSMYSIGPQSEGDYLGGEAYWAGAVHLYTPLPFRPGKGGFGDLFRTHFFLNAGNLCNLNYGDGPQAHLRKLAECIRWSYGAGIVLRLGNIARLELNYCIPMGVQSGDRICDGFQFGAGIRFL